MSQHHRHEAGIVDAVKKVAKTVVDSLGGGKGSSESKGFKAPKAPVGAKPPAEPKTTPVAPVEPAALPKPTTPKLPKPPKQLRTGETSRMRPTAIKRAFLAETAADDWWSRMTDHEKQAYKKAHPRSKYAKQGGGKAVAPANDYDRDAVNEAFRWKDERKPGHKSPFKPDPDAKGPGWESWKDDTPEANKKFKRGDSVRVNRQGEPASRVISVNHPMVTTTRGEYHHTKLVHDRK